MICDDCGTDVDEVGIYGCDILTDRDGGSCFLVWSPCCETRRDTVALFGFAESYGVTLEDVVELIVPGIEVLEILDHGDGSIVARLGIIDPTVDAGDDGKGHRKAKAPSGWRDRIFEDVTKHHRHHEAPQGHKFSIAVYNGETRVGVAVVGRPVSRRFAEARPDTLEVVRVAVWGHRALRKNAVSKLYAAAARRARSLGYTSLITYTLEEESGHSLEASGWIRTATTKGGSWNRRGRQREDKAPITRKTRWERGLTKKAKKKIKPMRFSA
ncbi:MAG TPA: hypothetical protein ENK57_10815 [Polyangiaceae bacterium]|nr:hypothetical protein [Polyangiaceae bacterium]